MREKLQHLTDIQKGSSVDIQFLVKGKAGVVRFLIRTDWDENKPQVHLYSANLGYHSRTALYDGQIPKTDCPYIGGANCYYYELSLLHAEELWRTMIRDGVYTMWAEMEYKYYEFKMMNAGEEAQAAAKKGVTKNELE